MVEKIPHPLFPKTPKEWDSSTTSVISLFTAIKSPLNQWLYLKARDGISQIVIRSSVLSNKRGFNSFSIKNGKLLATFKALWVLGSENICTRGEFFNH
jgi:hypothetical protein